MYDAPRIEARNRKEHEERMMLRACHFVHVLHQVFETERRCSELVTVWTYFKVAFNMGGCLIWSEFNGEMTISVVHTTVDRKGDSTH